MANLKEIRTRISSITSTRQITSAMKMVSAAKLRKAQDAIVQLRPYADKLQDILKAISDALHNDNDNVYLVNRNANKVLLVVITSNKGLCGAFNTNVQKMTVVVAHEKYGHQLANGNVDFYAIGKKGYEFLKKRKYNVVKEDNDLFDDLTYENAAEKASGIMKMFAEGRYDCIELIYNQFRNAAVQNLTEEQFLPVPEEKDEPEKEKGKILQTHTDYIFEPSKEDIIHELIPKSLKLQFFKALLDSFASEHGARMTAMHKATDNATDLIKELKLDYNKARQASITNEILEIVSGANALEDG
ncbi:MAG TPA: ATP synthase F1 subunit gamma [Bacteroidales bacterium]|nr:ATP synthase F1 subunit gamma [Bacteroidales bacterium]